MSETTVMQASSVKEFTVDYNWFEVGLAVDLNVFTKEKAEEINNFWSDGQEWLDGSKGDVVQAALKRIARVCFFLVLEHDYNRWGVQQAFDYDDSDGGIEGYPKMDGSAGIVILFVERITMDASDMSIKFKDIEQLPPPAVEPQD